MAKQLPDNKLLQGIFEPLNAESNINDLIVTGEIPSELNGIFFRNGPNPQYVFSENYHFFEGDSMIHAMRFQNGQVSYDNRWIRTEKFKLERNARKSLFAGFRDFGKSDPKVKDMRADTVNTNILWHGNKLLALQESTLPFEISHMDLSTIGSHDFGGKLKNSMTAHPKIDPATGELIFYNYINPIETEHIYYYVADKNGQIIKCEKIAVPYLGLLHDFAITKDFVILPFFPLVCSYERLFNGGDFYQWEPERGAYFGIMPRNGASENVIWIHIPDASCLAFHTVASYQDDDYIILDTMLADNIPSKADGFKADADVFPAYLTRWIFDLPNEKLLSKVQLSNIAGEFPKIDERFMGYKYNHAYFAGTLHSHWYGFSFDTIIHYDLANNETQIHDFGINSMPAEPIFVPRKADAKEGDGFLLTYVYRTQDNRSDLVIFDASHIDKEPLATIHLPHRVPFGFHGSWVML